MTDFVSPPDPQETADHLNDLITEVNKWAGDLDAGEEFPVAVEDIRRYQQAKIKFTNPESNLERLTEATFEKVGVQLSPLQAEQMRTRYDFYHMTLSVQMRPEPGTHFRALGCQLNFGMDGNQEPIVATIFPNEKWKKVFEFGGGMTLGLDGNLDFEIGVDTITAAAIINLPAELKTKVVNKNALKSIIHVPEFSYARGRFDIAAYGPDGSECYWYFDNQEITQTLTEQFTIIFKVPQGAESISLRGVAWAEPHMDKLVTNFRHVVSRFTESLRNLFTGPNKGAKAFAVTKGEKWDKIELPQPATADL